MGTPTVPAKARAERCVCGGLIVAPEEAPGPAVLAHGRSPRHEAWRLGLRVRIGVDEGPTLDGQPTWTLEERDPVRGAA